MSDQSSKAISIRAATEADFPRLIELFSEFAAFENLQYRMTNSISQMKAEREFFNGFVAVNFVGEIVGYATWFYCYYTFSGKAIYMDDLYITPEYRGNGLGTRLINRVIEQARESGCGKLRWQVSEWNQAAIGFYEQLGAEIDEVERNCNLDIA